MATKPPTSIYIYIIYFSGIFPYKPTILDTSFMETPIYAACLNYAVLCTTKVDGSARVFG